MVRSDFFRFKEKKVEEEEMGHFDFLSFEEKKIEEISNNIKNKYGKTIEEFIERYYKKRRIRVKRINPKEIKVKKSKKKKAWGTVEVAYYGFENTESDQPNISENVRSDSCIKIKTFKRSDCNFFERSFMDFIFNQNFKDVVQADYINTFDFSTDMLKDVEIAIFMFVGYYDAEECSFKDALQVHSKIIETHEKTKNIPNPYAIECFPFHFKIEDRYITENWCEAYKHRLFNLTDLQIFDLKAHGNNITNYGFHRTKKIYESLRESTIENILMLDISLGLSLTNIIYSYSIPSMEIYNKVEDIVRTLSSIFGIHIRANLAKSVFAYLSYNRYSEKSIEDVKNILKIYAPRLNECFVDMLQVSWWIEIKIRKMNFKEEREKYIKDIRKELENLWEWFYDDSVLCKDWMKMNGIYYYDEEDVNGSFEKRYNIYAMLLNEKDKEGLKYREVAVKIVAEEIVEQNLKKNRKNYLPELIKRGNEEPNTNDLFESLADIFVALLNESDKVNCEDEKIDKEVIKQKLREDEGKIFQKYLLELVREKNKANYSLFREKEKKITRLKDKLDDRTLYAVIHYDVVRTGLKFLNSEVFKKVKRDSE